MKKLFLLLTAITTVGFAGNTLTVEAGLKGDPTSKEAKAPISLAFNHSDNGFKAGLKLSNEAKLKFDTSSNEYNWKDTKLEANMGYESEKFSRTTWNFDLKASSKLTANTLSVEGSTGFSHDFDVVKLGESLSYEYGDNILKGKVTVDAPLGKHSLNSYVESGYNFKDSKILLNAKLGATVKHDLFTYKPFFETKNTFKKETNITFEESKNTFEIGAFSFSPKGVNIDTSLKINVNKKTEITADLDSSVAVKYKYMFNDKVSLTPSVKVGLTSELKKQGEVKLTPEVKLDVDQKVTDKLSLGYAFNAKVTGKFTYDSSAYKTTSEKAELGAKFTVKYSF